MREIHEVEVMPLSAQLFDEEELAQREAKAAAEFARIQQLIRSLIRLNREADRTWRDLRHHMGWSGDDEVGAPNRPLPPSYFETAQQYIDYQVEVQAFDEQASRLRKRYKQAMSDAENTRKVLFRMLNPDVWYYADNHGVMNSSGQLVVSAWSDLPTADRVKDIEF